MRNKILAVLFAGLLVVTAGCGSDKPKVNPTTSVGPQAGASATPSPAASSEPPNDTGADETPSAGSSTGAGVPCANASKWTTGSEDNTTMSKAGLYDLRAAKHDGCDRLVFDINGPGAAGYHAGYVDVVTTPGKGDAVHVKGTAALQVTVRAWDCGHFVDSTSNCPNWKVGQVLVDKPLGNVQEVKFAGVQEGQSTFAVGVNTKRPFHVTTWKAGDVMHVIVDIVH